MKIVVVLVVIGTKEIKGKNKTLKADCLKTVGSNQKVTNNK